LRPAVVVSGELYNETSPDVLIASITSNAAAVPHPGDHVVGDWQAAGLLRPSLLQTKLATVEATIVGRRLGSLSAADMAAFERGLREALAL
jgi:mRNA interferase MazF